MADFGKFNPLRFLSLKRLDLLIIRSFLGPFLVTFFVVLLVLTLQFYWVYMDELIGKGLSVILTIKLLLLMSATLFPLALPLGILLSAIMTFGNLSENSELIAIKSAGISLFRFMRPLFIVVGGLSLFAFLFNNYVIPVANLKSFSLLYDMRTQKPALEIKPGIFNKEFTNFVIRIGSKGKDGRTINDVLIYDLNKGENTTITLAEKGVMYPSQDGKWMIFELENGWRYQDQKSDDQYEQTRMKFQTWVQRVDMSGFSFTRTKEELFKSNEKMMNVAQLNQNIDSLKNMRSQTVNTIKGYIDPYFTVFKFKVKSDSLLKKRLMAGLDKTVPKLNTPFLAKVPDSMRNEIASRTQTNLRNLHRLVHISSNDLELQHEKDGKFKIEWHKKYTLSFACMLLFLIGAPLGAIIRKGGLGMPVVISVSFFVIYFIISSTGEKLAEQGAMVPWFGIWLATGVLLPIALVIMIAARNDSELFRKEWYADLFLKLKALFYRIKGHKQA